MKRRRRSRERRWKDRGKKRSSKWLFSTKQIGPKKPLNK
jgi:hypothetical protein